MPIPHVNSPEENVPTTTTNSTNKMPDEEVMPIVYLGETIYVPLYWHEAERKKWAEEVANRIENYLENSPKELPKLIAELRQKGE